MELSNLPDHLVILGGGYIALEFAQVFARLGSQVTVILRGHRFLPREDEDIAHAIKDLLMEEGITFVSASVPSVGKTSDGIELELNTGQGKEALQASHLMIAIGRTPNTSELNLEAAGVHVDKNGGIIVNERLETNVPNVWAMGDCNGGPLFTHVSWDDYRIIKDNVLNNAGRTTRDRLIPYTLFIDPELGRVGLTEQDALKQGYSIKVARVSADKIPRAHTSGETKGMLKAVIDTTSDQILGCSLLCHSAGEVMSVVQMAMIGKVPYTTVRDTIFTHPTMAESLNILFAGV